MIFGDRVCDALLATITDETLRRLPPFVGGLDQVMDSTDGMESTQLRDAIRARYRLDDLTREPERWWPPARS